MSTGNGLFSRLKKTLESRSNGLASLFSSSPKIDDSLYDELEDQLILADLGAQTAQSIIGQLKPRISELKLSNSSDVMAELRGVIVDILTSTVYEVTTLPNQKPYVILMVGVNGVGKTTTLAKLANQFKNQGNSVLLAACDTFRAAAIEQLQTWGQRLEIPVVAQSHGSDAAAVAFDAYSSAKARGSDILLIDSAGRQHTHGDLMDQLQKIKRVLSKAHESAPHEVYLTVDAGNGQNVISQVENFNKVIPLTGICITKLDGTAKGGIIIALADRFNIPIRYIGVGEGVDDLRPFDATAFVDALLPESSND
jgi:fused signal recognition particle receptor